MKKKVKIYKPCIECGGAVGHMKQGGDWTQDVIPSIEKGGQKSRCIGSKFGGPDCPPGSKQYNLAKTFKKLSKNRKEFGSSVTEQGQNTDTVITDKVNNFSNYLAVNTNNALAMEEMINAFGTMQFGGSADMSAYGFDPMNNVALSELLAKKNTLNYQNEMATQNFFDALSEMDVSRNPVMKTKMRPEFKNWYKQYNKAYKQRLKQQDPSFQHQPLYVDGGFIPFTRTDRPPETLVSDIKPADVTSGHTQEENDAYAQYFFDEAFAVDDQVPQYIAEGKPLLSKADFLAQRQAQAEQIKREEEKRKSDLTAGASKEKPKSAAKRSKSTKVGTNTTRANNQSLIDQAQQAVSGQQERVRGNVQYPYADNIETSSEEVTQVVEHPQLGVIHPNTGFLGRRGKAPLFYNPEDTYLEEVQFRNKLFGKGPGRVKRMKFTHYANLPGASADQTTEDIPYVEADSITTPLSTINPNAVTTQSNKEALGNVLNEKRKQVGLPPREGEGVIDDMDGFYGNRVPGAPYAEPEQFFLGGIFNPMKRAKKKLGKFNEQFNQGDMQMLMKFAPMQKGGQTPIADTYVKMQRDWGQMARTAVGPAMDFAAMIGRKITEPDVDQQIMDATTADNVFTPEDQVERGMNTFNPMGVVDPYGVKMAPQFTGMMKYGGQMQYEEGGTYDLSEEEVQRILASGGQIEYLD